MDCFLVAEGNKTFLKNFTAHFIFKPKQTLHDVSYLVSHSLSSQISLSLSLTHTHKHTFSLLHIYTHHTHKHTHTHHMSAPSLKSTESFPRHLVLVTSFPEMSIKSGSRCDVPETDPVATFSITPFFLQYALQVWHGCGLDSAWCLHHKCPVQCLGKVSETKDIHKIYVVELHYFSTASLTLRKQHTHTYTHTHKTTHTYTHA